MRTEHIFLHITILLRIQVRDSVGRYPYLCINSETTNLGDGSWSPTSGNLVSVLDHLISRLEINVSLLDIVDEF